MNISSSSLSCGLVPSEELDCSDVVVFRGGSHDATRRWLRASAMLARLKIMSASLGGFVADIFLFPFASWFDSGNLSLWVNKKGLEDAELSKLFL